MSQLQIFTNEQFGEIRTQEIDGKPYFMATDVAKALGYTNPQKAIRDHCKGVNESLYPTNGGQQKANFIPEGDIYRLVVKSQLPSAEKFESWVFDEILPSIRKHGGYIANQENLTNEQILANAMLVAQSVIANKDKQIEEMKPKALFADAVSTSRTSILVGDLAKIIKQNGVDIGAQRLFSWLRDNGYLIKRKGTDWNMPTQKSMDLSLFEIKESTHLNGNGCNVTTKTPKVTGKGQQYFINKLLSA